MHDRTGLCRTLQPCSLGLQTGGSDVSWSLSANVRDCRLGASPRLSPVTSHSRHATTQPCASSRSARSLRHSLQHDACDRRRCLLCSMPCAPQSRLCERNSERASMRASGMEWQHLTLASRAHPETRHFRLLEHNQSVCVVEPKKRPANGGTSVVPRVAWAGLAVLDETRAASSLSVCSCMVGHRLQRTF